MMERFKEIVKTYFSHDLTDETKKTKALYTASRNTIYEYTTYYPSGYGMYRFVYMHNFKYVSQNSQDSVDQMISAKSIIKENKCPCACICNSLLFLSLLLVAGVPSKNLIFVGQTKKNIVTSQKQTHWAASLVCEKLIKLDFGTFDEFSSNEHPLNSMVTFEKFTHEIIIYYFARLNTSDKVKKAILTDFHLKLQELINDLA